MLGAHLTSLVLRSRDSLCHVLELVLVLRLSLCHGCRLARLERSHFLLKLARVLVLAQPRARPRCTRPRCTRPRGTSPPAVQRGAGRRLPGLGLHLIRVSLGLGFGDGNFSLHGVLESRGALQRASEDSERTGDGVRD